MLEIDVPSIDPIQHEPKIVLGLTRRQALCIVPSVGLALFVFFLIFRKSTEWAVIAAIACMAPGIGLGWLRPYGLPLEQYLKIYAEYILNPQKRFLLTDDRKKLEEQKKLEKQNKKKVNVSVKKTTATKKEKVSGTKQKLEKKKK